MEWNDFPLSYVQIHDTEYGKTHDKLFSWLGATTLLQLDVQPIVSKDSMKRFCQHLVVKKQLKMATFLGFWAFT